MTTGFCSSIILWCDINSSYSSWTPIQYESRYMECEYLEVFVYGMWFYSACSTLEELISLSGFSITCRMQVIVGW